MVLKIFKGSERIGTGAPSSGKPQCAFWNECKGSRLDSKQHSDAVYSSKKVFSQEELVVKCLKVSGTGTYCP